MGEHRWSFPWKWKNQATSEPEPIQSDQRETNHVDPIFSPSNQLINRRVGVNSPPNVVSFPTFHREKQPAINKLNMTGGLVRLEIDGFHWFKLPGVPFTRAS